MNEDFPVTSFSDLALCEPVHKALIDVGYETPTPIQSLAIPHLLKGRDMVGQAQTGTGKTAAFALPFLSKIDFSHKHVQVLVLAPTRELAIQVAGDFSKYGAHIKGLKVLPIYGGQEYGVQLRALKHVVHVVVGTPGRIMDHMRRGTLSLDNLSCLVLDEADEMLRMGFIDDVEWILEQTPSTRQTALFSATMPKPIRNIAKRHLNNTKEIIIEKRTTAAESIRQHYLIVPGAKKIDALIRILEMKEFDAVLVFVKTKVATTEVAEKLVANGYTACALNGDLSQALRERTVNQLKNGKLNIIVATDVAARGLDMERISHVINYDAPFDAEIYVHRIGRTGRAGRCGESILFLTPQDRRILENISRATKQHVELMDIPSVKTINKKRIQNLKDKISETLQSRDISFFKDLIENYYSESDVAQIDIAAAVAHLLQGDTPLLLTEEKKSRNSKTYDFVSKDRFCKSRRQSSFSSHEQGMERYRIEVGNIHNVRSSNIVGAIANEAGIGSKHIGRINIYDDYSTVDLPEGMSRETLSLLKKVWVCNTQLRMFKQGNQETKKPNGAQSKSKPKKNVHTKQKAKRNRAKHKKKMTKAHKTERMTAA
ncbi:MAG: DEAD/DEAH box helicase [Proteobacteria bacterium]|nr:DEAD/DEAH box helicase [Pseudomonadota bacterium]